MGTRTRRKRFRILLDGTIRGGHFFPGFGRRRIRRRTCLPWEPFAVLLYLVHARVMTKYNRPAITSFPEIKGSTHVIQNAVYRLRKAIDKECGADTGKAMIVNASKRDHYLVLPRSAIIILPSIEVLARYFPAHIIADLVAFTKRAKRGFGAGDE